MDALQIIVSLAGGLGIGSLTTQYLAGGFDRRTARSEALRKLRDVETKRWAENASRDEFLETLHEFEAAALVAQVPRDAIELYKLLAITAADISGIDLNIDPAEELPGDIPRALRPLITEAAEEITSSIWHPFRSRVTQRPRVIRLEEQFLDITDARVGFVGADVVAELQYKWNTQNNTELPRPR